MSKVNLQVIVADPTRLADVQREDLPEVIRVFGGITAEAEARYHAPLTVEGPPPNGDDPSDHFLTVDQASAAMSVGVRWLYRHASDLPFTRRFGGRTLRFSEAGLKRWLASRPR